MHIPDPMLQGAVCPVTIAIAAGGVAAAVAVVSKSGKNQDLTKFAAVTSLIFAGQMLNFPIANGTSGHLLGGVLAAALLGAPLGVLSMTFVLAVQALIFGDGGMVALGANVTNMALIGVGVGALMNEVLRHRVDTKLLQRALLYGLAAWFSVMLAALGVCVELTASGAVEFGRVVPAMLGSHALIGIGEGLITGACLALLGRENAAFGFSKKLALTLAVACGAGLFLSPFASSFPDGLEMVAESLKFLPVMEVVRFAPLADYTVPGVGHPGLATGLAGLIGVLLTFTGALLVGRGFQKVGS
ncbi:MAG: energy-coupling factor ABC transporter permease [Syntrophotaleaceae bacterium]